MKHIPLLIIALCVLCGCNKKFYDGEGNKIPNKVVHLMVISQFAHMTHSEDSVINHYFYFNDLKK